MRDNDYEPSFPPRPVIEVTRLEPKITIDRGSLQARIPFVLLNPADPKSGTKTVVAVGSILINDEDDQKEIDAATAAAIEQAEEMIEEHIHKIRQGIEYS